MLAGCADGDTPRRESGRERALAAIRDCQVRSLLSLHSGRLFLELEGGGRIELTLDDQRAVYRELERTEPRCGEVTVATE